MEDKNLMTEKLRQTMIEETKDIELSQLLIDNIMSKRKKTWKEKLNLFLNKEIEISLIPVVVGLAGLFFITIIPKEVFSQPSMQTINIGSSHIIIRDIDEVAYNED